MTRYKLNVIGKNVLKFFMLILNSQSKSALKKCLMPHYYVIGIREKNILLNKVMVIDTLLRVEKLLFNIRKVNRNILFVSFSPRFRFLTTQLALYTGQNYIVGNWTNGFFSRSKPRLFKRIFFGEQRDTVSSFTSTRGLIRDVPIIFLVSMDNSENFLKELSYFNCPVIALTPFNYKSHHITYPILCETTSADVVLYYTRVLGALLNGNSTNPGND